MKMPDVEKFHNKPKFITNDSVSYLSLMGSRSYGGATPDSDYDFYGFVVPPLDNILPHIRGEINGFGINKQNFEQFQIQHTMTKYGETDIVIYNIVKYFQLVMECNPNMIHSLFVPENCVYKADEAGYLIRKNRHLFLSQKVYHTFREISYSHFHKLVGKHREEGSKRDQLIKKYGYDTKDASYCLRFLWELEELMTTGDLHIDQFGKEIVAVRNGKYSFHEINQIFEEQNQKLEKLVENTKKIPLPHSPKEQDIKQLLVNCIEIKLGSLSKIGYIFS